jgi:hypothetical protein
MNVGDIATAGALVAPAANDATGELCAKAQLRMEEPVTATLPISESSAGWGWRTIGAANDATRQV